MKKIITSILTVIILISCVSAFSACGKKIKKYELSEIEFSEITVDHYEYSYIEFNYDDGTYKLENKVKNNGIVTKQSGNFTVGADNNVTITNDDIPAQNYLLYTGEKAYFDGNKFHIEAYIPGYGNVYMIFESR